MAVVRLPTATRNAACDAVVDRVDTGGAGTIEIRTGTQPASANDAASGTLLGTLTFAGTAFGNAGASNPGEAIAAAITGDASADATGTATWARIKNGSAATVFDCDVTATGGGGAIQLTTTSIVATGPIDITSFTVTMPAA